MLQSFRTVGQAGADELVEKRSRFIGSACPVQTEEEARAFLDEIRAAHRDASHNCYAYILRTGQVQRYSDDGEPQGTAGLPILDVLRKEALWDAAIVVTRYFGGTLLGAGGLVRAYSHAARLAVDAAGRVEMCPCVLAALELPYPLYGKVETLLGNAGIRVLDSQFTDQVVLRLQMRAESEAGLQKELTELSSDTLFLTERQEIFDRFC